MALPFLLLLLLLTLLLPFLFSTPILATPSIIIHNTHPYPICLVVESSLGTFPTSTACYGRPGIQIPAYRSPAFRPSSNWIGALTPMVNTIQGTRFEINFSDTTAHPGCTWYDADMEMGLSASTLAPTDHRPRKNNKQEFPSVAGEQDPLAKANEAWRKSPNRWELLKYPRYVVADKGERLVWVYNDKQAPLIVQAFFQLEADFQAYMGPGSVEGKVPQGELGRALVRSQDLKAWFVDTQDLTVTLY